MSNTSLLLEFASGEFLNHLEQLNSIPSYHITKLIPVHLKICFPYVDRSNLYELLSTFFT